VSKNIPEYDPYSRFEDEGIPDLQSGTPEQQWAVDPQEEPLPADHPIAVDDFGTTLEEQLEGEPLAGRLAREIPEERPLYGPDEERGGGIRLPEEAEDENAYGRPPTGGADLGGSGVETDFDTGLDAGYEPGSDLGEDWAAQPEEPSGTVWDEPRPAGRLVAPDEGLRGDDEPDEIAMEIGPDMGGYSAEEAAMRVEPE
jgi:hypothetical protein